MSIGGLLPPGVWVSTMSGPSTMPLCQAWSFCISAVGVALPVGRKSGPRGTDHKMVLTGGLR